MGRSKKTVSKVIILNLTLFIVFSSRLLYSLFLSIHLFSLYSSKWGMPYKINSLFSDFPIFSAEGNEPRKAIESTKKYIGKGMDAKFYLLL